MFETVPVKNIPTDILIHALSLFYTRKATVPREKEQEFRHAMRLLGVKAFVYERDGDLMEAIADAMSETPSKPDDHGGDGASSKCYCIGKNSYLYNSLKCRLSLFVFKSPTRKRINWCQRVIANVPRVQLVNWERTSISNSIFMVIHHSMIQTSLMQWKKTSEAIRV